MCKTMWMIGRYLHRLEAKKVDDGSRRMDRIVTAILSMRTVTQSLFFTRTRFSPLAKSCTKSLYSPGLCRYFLFLLPSFFFFLLKFDLVVSAPLPLSLPLPLFWYLALTSCP